jgi:hypothetical protein
LTGDWCVVSETQSEVANFSALIVEKEEHMYLSQYLFNFVKPMSEIILVYLGLFSRANPHRQCITVIDTFCLVERGCQPYLEIGAIGPMVLQGHSGHRAPFMARVKIVLRSDKVI